MSDLDFSQRLTELQRRGDQVRSWLSDVDRLVADIKQSFEQRDVLFERSNELMAAQQLEEAAACSSSA
jgi:hypothetical protein